MDEEEAQGHFALAVALLWHREHDKALVEARRCVALEPNSAEGHIAIAHILTYSGNAQAAISTIDAYIKLDPFYKDIVLYFLAEARISLGADRRGGRGAQSADRAQPKLRDLICSASVMLRPTR